VVTTALLSHALAGLGLALGLGAKTQAKPKKKPKKCKRGLVPCGRSKTCVDTRTNARNCGGCGKACAAGQSCVGGRCQGGGCPSGRTRCGTSCVDTQTDHANCNGCGKACGSTETCHGGTCVTAGSGCPAGQSECPGSINGCYHNPQHPDGPYDAPTLCGSACKDCTQGGAKPYVCCWLGDCVDVSGRKPNESGILGAFCGGCEKCSANRICCNDGRGGAPSCKDPANGGFCPLPGA
jgi:hypothetical protein